MTLKLFGQNSGYPNPCPIINSQCKLTRLICVITSNGYNKLLFAGEKRGEYLRESRPWKYIFPANHPFSHGCKIKTGIDKSYSRKLVVAIPFYSQYTEN